MYKITRSALFKRQLIEITSDYRKRAGSPIALKFVDGIEASIAFIAETPQACAIYTHLHGNEFRKWGVNGFPVSLFFRIENTETIVLEALYAHRMNIAERMLDDIE